MRKRTFDIIAKYIGQKTDIKVVMSPDVPGPCVDLKTRTIKLPEKIQNHNALSALSNLIHEAAHVKYTHIPPEMSKNSIDHFIINALEDIRIDRLSFNLLPNIYDFYEIFIKEHVCSKNNKEELANQHMLTRSLIQLILEKEYFHKYCWDREAQEFMAKKGVYDIADEGMRAIHDSNWKLLKEKVNEIRKIFGIKPNEGEPSGKNQETQGAGETPDRECSGNGAGSEVNDGRDRASGSGSTERKGDIKNPEKFIRPGSVWSKGEGLQGPGGTEFSPLELTNTTKAAFIEALNVKEKYIQDNGRDIDTDSLIAFFTGQIDELFKDNNVEKVKKSKIVFCIDASGSMCGRLMDGKSRRKTLASCISSLINLLDEVREVEGLNVDYEVIAFAYGAKRLGKDWKEQYMHMSGGTHLYSAVKEAINAMNEQEIDGNKIVIVVTDGEVSHSDIEESRTMINNNDSGIKMMFLGIGARIGHKMFGDNNILCLEHADQIIMEAIQTMLEG